MTREKNVITFDLSSYDGICSGTITFDEGEESSTFYFDVVEHISDQDLIGTYQSEKKKFCAFLRKVIIQKRKQWKQRKMK